MDRKEVETALVAGRWARNWREKLLAAIDSGKVCVTLVNDQRIDYTQDGESKSVSHPLARWSIAQRDVFKEVATASGHAIILARAGCGKTTTLTEACKYVPAGKSALACAFNKEIERELSRRLPPGIDCSTLHGLGLRAVARAWNAQPDERDSWNEGWLKALPKGSPKGAIAKIASLCKSMLISEESAIIREARARGLWPRTLGEREDKRIAGQIQAFMDYALKPHKLVSFDDMVYVAAKLDLVGMSYDIVFVDETQDMSAAQLRVARNHLQEGGRLVLIGDDRQAIYAFRGADSQGIERMRRELKAKVLPLTTTYRCAKAIVALAKAIVPDFEAAPGNPEGTVSRCSELEMENRASAGDAILSRKNAPLVATCLSLIRTGKRARVRGKDIGRELASLVRKSGASTVKELLVFLDGWVKDAIDKLPKAETEEDSARVEEAAQKIYDTAETLRSLAEGLTSVSDVLARIEDIFGDETGDGVILLSSVHKAKGLEWNRVFLLEWTMRSGSVEEDNIRYVAITRAKSELVFVHQRAK